MSRSSLRHQDVKIKSSFGEEGGGATDCYCSKPTLSSWLSFPVTLFRNSHSVWSVSTSPVCLARINSCDINCFLSGSLTKRNSATWSCNQHWVTLVVYHSSRHCSDVFAFFFPPAATITIWTAVTKKCQFIVGSDSQVVNIHFLSSHSISTNPASLPAQRVSQFQNGRWMIWLEFTPSHLRRCWDVHVGGELSLWPRDFQQKCCHPLALLCQRFSLQDPGGREGDFCYMRMVVEMGLRSKCCCCWPAPRPLSLKDAPRGQELLLHARIFQRFVAIEMFFFTFDTSFQLNKSVWTMDMCRVIFTFFYATDSFPSNITESFLYCLNVTIK